MFEKNVGEFTVSVTDPYPYWISVEHEFCDAKVRFEHEQLDDLIYALTQARKHIDASRAAQRMRPSQATLSKSETVAEADPTKSIVTEE